MAGVDGEVGLNGMIVQARSEMVFKGWGMISIYISFGSILWWGRCYCHASLLRGRPFPSVHIPPFPDRRLHNGVAAVAHESLGCRIMISVHWPLKLR